MRKLLCLVLLCGALSRLYGEETLPKITPATLSEIQRLAITLRIAEFPLTQQEYRTHLALPLLDWEWE